jgi:hypothetical protein
MQTFFFSIYGEAFIVNEFLLASGMQGCVPRPCVAAGEPHAAAAAQLLMRMLSVTPQEIERKSMMMMTHIP